MLFIDLTEINIDNFLNQEIMITTQIMLQNAVVELFCVECGSAVTRRFISQPRKPGFESCRVESWAILSLYVTPVHSAL